MSREVVFVFGSNLAGRHGKGAALEAVKHWGAEYGIGEGRTGNSYAIPTKDEDLNVRSLEEIRESYSKFVTYATDNPDIQFLLTPFGTGLAGYGLDDIRSIVHYWGYFRNIWMTGDWKH